MWAWLSCFLEFCCFGPCGWLRCLNMFWTCHCTWLLSFAQKMSRIVSKKKRCQDTRVRFCRWPRFAFITIRSLGRHAQSIIMCNLETFSAWFFILWSEEIRAQQDWLRSYQDVIAISNGRSRSGQVVVNTVRQWGDLEYKLWTIHTCNSMTLAMRWWYAKPPNLDRRRAMLKNTSSYMSCFSKILFALSWCRITRAGGSDDLLALSIIQSTLNKEYNNKSAMKTCKTLIWIDWFLAATNRLYK